MLYSLGTITKISLAASVWLQWRPVFCCLCHARSHWGHSSSPCIDPGRSTPQTRLCQNSKTNANHLLKQTYATGLVISNKDLYITLWSGKCPCLHLRCLDGLDSEDSHRSAHQLWYRMFSWHIYIYLQHIRIHIYHYISFACSGHTGIA